MIELRDRYKAGIASAWKFFSFLVRNSSEDVEQEVRLAVVQSSGKSDKEFNNQVQRNLYHLAKANGFRKTNPWAKRSKDVGTAHWEKPICSLSEIDYEQGI